MRPLLPRLLREPLVHFVLLGALIFAVHAARGGSVRAERADVIVVDSAVRARLTGDFERIESRPPTESELDSAVDAWVADQVLSREARALGLDRGDLVVERRLSQKMGFLLRSEADPPRATDGELQAVLDGGGFPPDPATYRLEHRVFRSDRANASGDARRAVTALSSGATADSGDPSIHGGTLGDDAAGLDARFGPGFAAALDGLEVGTWGGPVRSRFGLHVVRIHARTPARPVSVETHRDALEAIWLRDRRDSLERERVRRLVDRYEVRR